MFRCFIYLFLIHWYLSLYCHHSAKRFSSLIMETQFSHLTMRVLVTYNTLQLSYLCTRADKCSCCFMLLLDTVLETIMLKMWGRGIPVKVQHPIQWQEVILLHVLRSTVLPKQLNFAQLISMLYYCQLPPNIQLSWIKNSIKQNKSSSLEITCRIAWIE